MKDMKKPENLKIGDKIAILSPATTVKPDYIDHAVKALEAEGLNPVIMPHAKGPAQGTYAASDADRLSDILTAITDPHIKAILCARGGYGCNHLLHNIPVTLIAENPKWLIGFSDISALHALWQKAGVISLHAPMAKHLSLLPADDYCTRAMMHILFDGLPIKYITPAHPLNTPGESEGIIAGGNLAVINGLAATPFDPMIMANSDDGMILFIEDIAEKIYAVERMLIRLILSGQLQKCKALVVGHFTEYNPDSNHADMEHMIRDLLDRYDIKIPVAFGFPAGHTDDNLPLPLGARVSISVTPDSTILTLA